MNGHFIQDALDRILSIAPITPEAYPKRIGAVPAGKDMIRIAWEGMEVTMFAAGLACGIGLAVVFFLAIVFKSTMPSIAKVLSNATN